MAKEYDARNWYWAVGGSLTQVFSSANGNYVPISDATFLAWKADGTSPTSIDTEADLGQVLAQAVVIPVAAGVLDGYKTSEATNIIAKIDFKIAFSHENRIRACERALSINGSPPAITPAQALALVKGLM